MTEVGLCRNRHPLPVEEYIFEQEINPLDFNAMHDTALKFVLDHCNIIECGQWSAPNQTDWTDVSALVGDELIVYATGLTAALCAVINVCQAHGVPLTVMHYDRVSGEYLPQKVLAG